MGDFRTPGQYIRELLEERGWGQAVLAAVLGCDPPSVSKLISGTKAIDAKTALMLSAVFGVPPERFLELQQRYDLEKARIEIQPDQRLASRAELFSQLPISEMKQRGWINIPNIRNTAQVEGELAKFFGVEEADAPSILSYAAKKTETTTPATGTQRAWINRVKQIASGMAVAKYSRNATVKALDKLSALLMSPDEARHIPRILAEAGIRFVLVEGLKSGKIDGVTLWLAPDQPVIGMSMRLDRIDNFWFVLRHEIEHVLRDHGKQAIIVDELEGERAGTSSAIPNEERLANGAAADFCVPQAAIDSFIARKSGIFSERDLIGFARLNQVHPGIVVGQLHNKTQRYELFRKHLIKVRAIVAGSAMVDGWGDIAPV